MGVEESGLGEEESSLADFEEEFLKEKKSKNMRNLLILLILLAVLGGGGYYYLSKSGKPSGSTETGVEQPAGEIAESDQGAKPVEPETDVMQVEERDVGVSGETVGSKSPARGTYTVFVGTFRVKTNADRMVGKLEKAGIKPVTEPVKVGMIRNRILVGHYPFKEVAAKEAEKMFQQGFKPAIQLVKAGDYSLVMGSFESMREAEELITQLEDKGYPYWSDRKETKEYYEMATSVKISGVPSEKLQKVLEFLDKEKIEYVMKKSS